MAYLFPFEKLEVWQVARRLVKRIYEVTKNFPTEEKFGLTNQLRRAIVSVSSNLAEGSCRNSFKDQARFSEIAYGSLMEVMNQLISANDLLFISNENLEELRETIIELSNKINALHNSQVRRIAS